MGFFSFYHLSYPLSIQGLFIRFHSIFSRPPPLFINFLFILGSKELNFFPENAE